CPRGTRPIGGGALASSTSLLVTQSSSLPVAAFNGWSAAQNNLSTSDTVVTAYAVGARLKGYLVVRGPSVDKPPGARTGVTVACPSPLVPVGGGIDASSHTDDVAIASTLPVAASWTSFQSNPSAGDASAVAVAVCAGT